jgi:c-di-GMP-binding flagellar brake protein YcgR
MGSEQQFFNPVLENEKTSILQYIQTTNAECVIKVFDSFWKTQFLKTKSGHIQILKKNFTEMKNEKIIVSFESVGDHFFFESVIEKSENQLVVGIPEKIFKLQRRNDFRVTIPSNIKPIVKILKSPELKVEIRDMSLGGCKLAIKTEFKLDFAVNTEIEIHLKIMEFEEKRMYAEVKFVDFIENAKTFILGIKFVELNSDQTTLMRNTLLQIDRILRQKSQD